MIYLSTYASREFYTIDREYGFKNVIGYINVYLLNSKTKIELCIMFLQENGMPDDIAGQAIVMIDYPEDASLYNIINCIFEKITEDHKYKLDGIQYIDIIYCSDEFVKTNTNLEILYDETNFGHWIPFTKENTQYLEYETEESEPYDEKYVIIYGKVEYDSTKEGGLVFTYDAPIVSKDVTKEYYEITRGRRVWDVRYNRKTNKCFVVDPNVEYESDTESDLERRLSYFVNRP